MGNEQKIREGCKVTYEGSIKCSIFEAHIIFQFELEQLLMKFLLARGGGSSTGPPRVVFPYP
jgi:hypothetical protein